MIFFAVQDINHWMTSTLGVVLYFLGHTPKKKKKEGVPDPKKPFQAQSDFIIKLFDESPSIALEEVKRKLMSHFSGLETAISSLYDQIGEKCAITIK